MYEQRLQLVCVFSVSNWPHSHSSDMLHHAKPCWWHCMALIAGVCSLCLSHIAFSLDVHKASLRECCLLLFHDDVSFMQGYRHCGTYFKFEGSQNTVTLAPHTTAVAQDGSMPHVSVISFTGCNLSEQVRHNNVNWLVSKCTLWHLANSKRLSVFCATR